MPKAKGNADQAERDRYWALYAHLRNDHDVSARELEDHRTAERLERFHDTLPSCAS